MDMYHVTHDIWRMICDMWGPANILSQATMVWEGRCSEDLEEKGDSLN